MMRSVYVVVPALVDRLGDAKDQVREQAQALILKLMEQCATPMVSISTASTDWIPAHLLFMHLFAGFKVAKSEEKVLFVCLSVCLGKKGGHF